LIHLFKACRANALIEKRDYVIPDDVKHLLEPTLSHRIWLSRESQIEGLKVTDVIRHMVNEAAIPGMRAVGSTK